jgi:thiaminase
MNGKYNGQTKLEYLKNYKRVNDMLAKSPGDEESQCRLAQKQANAITDEMKALNRAMVAKELGQEHIFEVFSVRLMNLVRLVNKNTVTINLVN